MKSETVTTQFISLSLPEEGFVLASGDRLPEVEVAYETYGKLNLEKSNAVLICSPLTTDAHAAGYNEAYEREKDRIGWWDDMIGPGKAIDTNKYFVIASNMLGGCKGTTGPLSKNPATGKPYGKSFPRITVQDIVAVQNLLVKQLGANTLEAVIGGSMGGMQALQWTVSFPKQVKKCICIAASARLSAQALGFEVIGRKLIVNDPNYYSGDYYQQIGKPHPGLKFARMIGHLTYLSAHGMDRKFGRKQRVDENPSQFQTGFEVETYLEHQGESFVNRFDANSYLHITYAMDRFDLIKQCGSLEKAFEKSEAEFCLVALSSDWLFPTEQTKDLAKVLVNNKKITSMVELQSPYGHDAFLLEVENLSNVINGFLEKPTFALKKPVPSKSPQRMEGKDPYFSDEKDFEMLQSLIEPKAHILDIGCGDGSLIDKLYRLNGVTGIGIDIDLSSIVECLKKNVPVIQDNVDAGLSLIGDQQFDYAVLNQTLQVVRKPRLLLNEMLRVAKKGIVSFPNFAHWPNRAYLGSMGKMPKSPSLPFEWYNTPNIHLFSLRDFRLLCKNEGIKIEKEVLIGPQRLSSLFLKMGFPNLGAETVIAKISKE